MRRGSAIAIGALGLSLAAQATADSEYQMQIDACIDRLRATLSDGNRGGQVLRTSFSEAGTLVVLEDADGTVWECIAYSDGTVGDLRETTLSAQDVPQGPPEPERIQFAAGTSGAEITRQIEAGGAMQFVLGARRGQELSVRVVPRDGGMYYQIINPDESRLLDGTDAAQDYHGQLLQTGDHVIEVVSRERSPMTFTLIVGIE